MGKFRNFPFGKSLFKSLSLRHFFCQKSPEIRAFFVLEKFLAHILAHFFSSFWEKVVSRFKY